MTIEQNNIIFSEYEKEIYNEEQIGKVTTILGALKGLSFYEAEVMLKISLEKLKNDMQKATY